MDAKTLCLGILATQDASGYEIRKICETGPFSFFHQIGFGSIYPALNRIQEDGLATCSSESQTGRPDKKVYSLTDTGLRAFFDTLTDEPSPDKLRSETLFLLFFGAKLSKERRGRLLESYKNFYAERLRALKSKDTSCASEGHRFVHGFGLALYQAAFQYLNDHGDQFIACEELADPSFDVLNHVKNGAPS